MRKAIRLPQATPQLHQSQQPRPRPDEGIIPLSSQESIERRKFIDLLSAETNEKFVELVLKFNATLSRLAEERFIDKEELVAEEIGASKVKVVGKEK